MKKKTFLWYLLLPSLLWTKDSLTSEVKKLLKVSNYQQAREVVQMAIQREPDISSHYILLSQIYQEERLYSNAYRVISKAYNYFPENPWVAKELADVYRQMGEYKKALDLYRQWLPTIEEKYRNLWYYGMGVCYFELENYEKAILFLEQSTRGKISFWALYYLGRSYRAKGYLQKALWAFERSELQLFLQPEWAKPLLYYEWGITMVEFGITVKQTNTIAAKTIFVSLLEDKRFSDRRVKERAEFWVKRL
ncbi:MAG: tetratricopeptide repeat protein [Brevinematales bacterium]